jgi:hypothetical protein
VRSGTRVLVTRARQQASHRSSASSRRDRERHPVQRLRFVVPIAASIPSASLSDPARHVQ